MIPDYDPGTLFRKGVSFWSYDLIQNLYICLQKQTNMNYLGNLKMLKMLLCKMPHLIDWYRFYFQTQYKFFYIFYAYIWLNLRWINHKILHFWDYWTLGQRFVISLMCIVHFLFYFWYTLNGIHFGPRVYPLGSLVIVLVRPSTLLRD